MNLSPDPITLAIETATPYLALGLLTPHGEFCEVRQVGRAHAEQLPAALEMLFAAANLPKSAVQQIVIGTGPGSYTGVRVGASYALGLGRAIGAPVLGIGTLESLIDAQHEGEQAVSLDARKGQLYGAVYRVSGGSIVQTLLPAAKYDQADFAERVSAYVWRQDPAPDAAALARAGRLSGAAKWTLQYL
ncbi:tRNA (adenosine(37)-N6)-threonylcarbamoyltransferase complex dimerization subunit type 1 TsaB [Deinococcus detaillensis]|uniref:tRNA (Adenosine(37)-N6)-threonylcarbamoyltransferase complex dimerization subunit type 1 TsaB n=1 Tax=Deinococcus detaillensis TaxID=2592048 RepID=A0A553V0F9_9DEIO|nr:tRNA (adenosine(37)-N6)-threonylcarbamoyltransferase complex dimerization subunit type 1 TsaB [Deinococcus detaillensis]TSA85701.1 tRNA (adenosine(37)-N6)-threonylcarbamoyltransferase complex dimerization subunit type 1 TsaB [Deinococcus detaillensis]